MSDTPSPRATARQQPGACHRAAARLGRAALCASLVCLAGCAGQKAFDEGQALMGAGQVDAGLAKLEEAVRLAPGNAQYRIGLVGRRASLVQRLYAAAELARREERSADAELAYRQVLRFDAQHSMAQQGLAALATDARHRTMVADADALFAQAGVAQAAPALDRLRAVLAADPRHKAALRLKERIDDAQARVEKSDTRLAESFRKPISLQFSDAPLRAIFDAISRISGLSFFFDKDVRADARGTILARNTTVEDAVRLLLLTNQLDQKVLNDSSLLVYPNTPQKQKDYQTLVVRSFFLANADVKAVSNAIKAIVKTKDLVIDERLGTILMRDTADAVRVAERIVALHDLSDPEVMLEVEVLEVKRSRLQELGLQWPGQLTLAPLAVSGTGTTLADLRNLSSTTIGATLGSAVINLNKQDQNANILTNPRIRVRNKEKAKIQIGDRIPVITTTTSGTASFVSESVSYLDVGLKLEVEPTVYLDDEVAIKLNLEVSTLVKEVLTKSGTLTYQIGSRGASTVLRLKDGETQVLAGLISDEDRSTANKVPGLGDLPVMGRLFGSQKDDDQRSEILLSITPRVLRSLRRPDLREAEFDAGTENAVGLPPLRLQRVDADEPRPPGAVPGAALGAALSAAPDLPRSGASGAPAVARPGAPLAGFAPISPLPAVGNAPRLLWQGPSQTRVGQTFSVLLRGLGAGGWRELPLQIGFDPQALQLLELRPGSLFDPSDGSGSLLQPGDARQSAQSGQLRLTLARPAEAADAAPAAPDASGAATAPASAAAAVPGLGNKPANNPANGLAQPPADLLVLTFKALRAADSTALRLRQADPQPAPAAPLALPADHLLRVLP